MQHVLNAGCLNVNWKVNEACNFDSLVETVALLKITVTYTINVVTTRKRCKIETFLLQTTNRK